MPVPLRSAALLATLLLAAPAAAQSDGDPGFPTLAAGAKAGEGAVRTCEVIGLEGNVRCGVFRVFEDREASAGRTIDLHFVVVPALDSARRARDVAMFFVGGPGATTIPATAAIARTNRDLRRTRDLLLVDLRGVGRSAGLDCDVGYPGGIRSRFAAVFPIDLLRRCREELSKRARLDRYTTAATVDDLEELRRWLGYAAVDLIGGSYGSRVVQVYLRRHPRSVRVAVMNGVMPVDVAGYVQSAPYMQQALERFVAECEGDAACRRRHPRLGRKVADVVARLRAAPADVRVEGETVPFSAGNMGYALRGLLYNRARDVPRLVEQAAAGDFRELVQYYVARTSWVGAPGGGTGNHFSVLCAEDIAPVTDQDVARAARGTYLGDFLIANYREICRDWPAARLPAEHFRPVRSSVPTLLLSGAHDPVTPPSGAERVARSLSRSLHVVVPTGGHGVGGPCVNAMIVRLVEDGTLSRVDASCIR